MQDYVVYCDETYIQKKVAFAFGGLICTPIRAGILKKKLEKIRSEFNCREELKWNRISFRLLNVYRVFVGTFLNDPHVRYSVMPVIKGPYWNDWEPTEEERFFKAYYLFLMRNIRPYSRYEIYCDTKELQKSYRWSRMHYLINQKRRIEWDLKRKNVRKLEHKDSKTEDLLQRADILLGCHFNKSNSNSKQSIRNMVFSTKEERTFKCHVFLPSIIKKRSFGSAI
jgi:hypothetical protein